MPAGSMSCLLIDEKFFAVGDTVVVVNTTGGC